MKILYSKLETAELNSNRPISPLYCGISINSEDRIQFNWERDSSEDVLHLIQDTSGIVQDSDIAHFFAYTYSTRKSANIFRVRQYLKHIGKTGDIYSEDVEEFVQQAIFKLDSAFSLDNFDVLVSTDSTSSPSLVDIMGSYLSEFCRKPTKDLKLIKKCYKDVQFDAVKAYKALINSGYSSTNAKKSIQHNVKKFEELKKSGQLFQMKRFLPREIRSGFYDFLKFRTEEDRNLYLELQGANVLIYDDFLTSGSTIREIVRYLKSINNSNSLTVFVLVKQIINNLLYSGGYNV